jgi:hypothetical protein
MICQLKPIFAPIMFRIASLHRPHDSCPPIQPVRWISRFKRWPWRTHGYILLILGRSYISSDINQTTSPHPPSSSLSELRQVSRFGALLSASNSGLSKSSRVTSSLEQPISSRMLPSILFGPLSERESPK